jgi:purine-binding chemotaxis protein CheW
VDGQRADGYVVLRLGGARYAVAMSAVGEVGRLPALSRVPGTPSWLAGVANWRGRILAVVDIRPLLGVAITPTGSLGRLVVLGDREVTVGLCAEGVHGIVEFAPEAISPPPSTLDAEISVLLLGQITEAGSPIAVLDPRAVLNLRLRLPAARRAAS